MNCDWGRGGSVEEEGCVEGERVIVVRGRVGGVKVGEGGGVDAEG